MTDNNFPSWREFRKEIKQYNLGDWQQRGYDEALLPDPLDWLVKKHTPEDEALAKELRSLNTYQRMAYTSGRLKRLELRGMYVHPTQTVFDVDATPCRYGWTRHPIRLVPTDEQQDWQHLDGDVVTGYRNVYLGDTTDGRVLQYLNDVVVTKHGDDDYRINERLTLREIDSHGHMIFQFFEDWLPAPDGYIHRSEDEGRAAALKYVFDDWRDAVHETPDERILRRDPAQQ